MLLLSNTVAETFIEIVGAIVGVDNTVVEAAPGLGVLKERWRCANRKRTQRTKGTRLN